MKYLIIIAFSVLTIRSVAQNTYNNTIGQVTDLNIKGNNSTINIGKIIINPTLRPKLILSSYSQKKDTGNLYVTTFTFNSVDNLPFFGVKLDLKFNSPVISSHFSFNGTAMNVGDGLSPEKLEYQFVASQINSDSFSVIIRSTDRVFTTISGVDEVVKQQY